MSAHDDLLKDLREAHKYDTNGWQDIRREAKKDMRYVAGDPWDDADKEMRKDRPTVAPEEMGQYFNQVINQLRANPRGMKFAPTGGGASKAGAEFYQNKAREIEYRSHAKVAYIAAAENAIQRSYGFVRVNTRYASSRSPNQEIWIEDFPNPDMVMPDCDAKRPDSSDMKRCWVYQWVDRKDPLLKGAKIRNFTDFADHYPQWIQGTKVLVSEYWTIATKPRQLLMVSAPPPPSPPRAIAPVPTQAPAPIFVFEDELLNMAPLPKGATVQRVREVDYPTVKMYLTNGLEILHEQDWPGKYIPIVSCYGKVIYIEGDTGMEKKILSMTRFGRDPWKSYCYACSQELEILAMIPKAPLGAYREQMNATEIANLEASMYSPKALITFGATTEATGGQLLPAPGRIDYPSGQHLQAIEVVKEGMRRAIQAAMGSNFLPTDAQHRSQKSGVALDKIEQAASTGTFHFVNNYDDMIRRVAEIVEDLIDKIYDFRGETGTIEADGTARPALINDPTNDKAISTKGDYLVTVSTAPSSDSEQQAAEQFTDTLVNNLPMIAQVAGPKAAAAVLARSVRMRNLGPQGDQLADLIEPPEFKMRDGEAPSPEVLAAKAEVQRLGQQLQEAGKIIATEQVKQQAQTQRELEKTKITERSNVAIQRMKDATEIAVAKLQLLGKGVIADKEADVEAIALAMEQAHEAEQNAFDRAHELGMAHVEQQHALEQGDQAHQQALEQGDQGIAGQMAVQAAAPPPDTQAGV